MNKGIIVSIQGYTPETTQELAQEAINAGAVGIRTDKFINCQVPIIGLRKVKDCNMMTKPYVTPSIEDIEVVMKWLPSNGYVAIDFRKLNKNLKEVNDYCITNKINVVADIGTYTDYDNIVRNNYKYAYIATTLSVFYYKKYNPDIELAKKLKNNGCKVIAEGNYKIRNDVTEVLDYGIDNVCMGTAISDIYKLTKKYTLLVR